MKKHFLLWLSLITCCTIQAQTDTLLHNYNSTIYPTVLSAAKDIALPFLIDQHYVTMANATVKDSTITYYGLKYLVHNYYFNPGTGYYIAKSLYATYGINIFINIWPTQIPNIFFKSADTSFNCKDDCVGYMTRVLSAVGDTTPTGNAYLNIQNGIRTVNTTPFAAKGYVATAYEFAAAFPTLPTKVASGWQYICGNPEVDSVNAYNHVLRTSINTYNGVRQGGFANSQAGDVLAFGYAASQSSNGHIMVMEHTPTLLTNSTLPTYFPSKTIASAQALIKKRHVYSVPLFDCSGLQAHFQDSRTLTSGIGHGTLLVITDTADDAPVGFIFDSLQAIYNPLHMDTLGAATYVISVGRFVTGITTGFNSNSILTSSLISVYPNPTKNLLNVSVDNGQVTMKGELLIYNQSGQKVYSQLLSVANSILSIDISGWAKGVYIIKYTHNDGTTNSNKFIKQ